MDCLLSSVDQKHAWKKCEDTLAQAIITQLTDDETVPRLISAIPTLGKTTAAGNLATDLYTTGGSEGFLYLSHLRRNRDNFENQIREDLTQESGITVVQLPVLRRDCPTAAGEHGSAEKDRILRLYDRGIPPGLLHSHDKLDFSCDGQDCQYMQQWYEAVDADILIGHPTHAYESKILENRVVVIDEGPGQAFETSFDADEWHRSLGSHLQRQTKIEIDSINEVKSLRQGEDPKHRREVLNQLREEAQESIFTNILETGSGHVDHVYAAWGLLEQAEPRDRSCNPPHKTRLANGVERAVLTDDTVVVYDPESGIITVRRTPEFNDQPAALIGLDGTPTESIWRGRLGIDEIEVEQVLCEDCRQTYLTEILGYKLVLTTRYRKPYSNTKDGRISYDKDRGLLHELNRRTSGDVGLISTKQAKESLLERDDANEVSISPENSDHYGNIRSSNRFQGSAISVGAVVGSPHPGSDKVRQIAGLDGVSYASKRKLVETDGHHYRRVESASGKRYLKHFRENRVAQAIFRFGRENGATVFIHTSAIPDWLAAAAVRGGVETRSKGEQAVLRALSHINEGTTSEFVDEIEVIGRSQIRKILNQFAEEGLVKKGGSSHKTIWHSNDEADSSPTAHVDLPSCD
jgi:hypothetical protein